MARKTKLMQKVEEEQQRPLERLLPEKINEIGFSATAKELGIEEELPYARAYRVFNADQIEGLPDEYYIRPEAPRDLGTAEDPELKAFFSRTGAEILTSDDPRAYYSPAKDHIHMPPIATFHNAAGYYGTLAHEVIHNAALRFMPRRPLQPVALRLDRRSISA